MEAKGTVRIGRRGTMVIPADMRRRYGLQEGTLAIVEGRPDGVLLRPATALPVEVYTSEEKAEFLLGNAVGPEDEQWAREEIRRMGLDPDAIRRGLTGR